MRHSDRVCLVTGGASGIGAATAQRLSNEGASVVIADIQEERARELAESLGPNARAIRTDVSVDEDVRAAVDLAVREFGRLDFAFANAGILGATGSILDGDVEWVEATLRINLLGTYLTMRHSARAILETADGGSIVATSSPAAIGGGIGPHAYGAAKAGVLSLVRSVAAELRASNVRINAIIPGSTVSAMTADIVLGDADNIDGAHDALRGDALLERPITGHDIAAAVSFLASDDATQVTAQSFAVDAGFTTITGDSPFTTGSWAKARLFREAGRRN